MSTKKIEYYYKLHRDVYKDAWNWWDACNSVNFGVDWSSRADPLIVKNIKLRTQKESFNFLIPYLKEKYQKENFTLKEEGCYIRQKLNQNFSKACIKLEEVMGKPLYRNSFHFYLTTFPSIPYNKAKGYIWLNYSWLDPIETFLHELCHLQFIHYWRENFQSRVYGLSAEHFELLKETLTIILDHDFIPLISQPDKGYKIHKKFRNKLKRHWEKNKNFDQLIEYALENVNYC